MKPDTPAHPMPADGAARKAVRPVICYPVGGLPAPDLAPFHAARVGWEKVDEVLVPAREARCFDVPAGHFFRITSVDGPQVGDLNLWNAHDLNERFFSGKTRALHGTHLSAGDRMWSSLPHLRSLATITEDTLDWYQFDAFGGGVHDVIGTRCDPYTHNLLSHGGQYHHCCHSNLTRALADRTGLPLQVAELHVHDVLNVFMCTGFTRDTGQYFMKASPVRPGDFIELFADIDLLGALSACPGGDCSAEHSSDQAACHPLLVEVFRPMAPPVGWAPSPANGYDRSHGRQEGGAVCPPRPAASPPEDICAALKAKGSGSSRGVPGTGSTRGGVRQKPPQVPLRPWPRNCVRAGRPAGPHA